MKTKPILILVLFVLTAFNTIGSLTIYEGAEFYGDNITLTFQSETTIRYLEVGENYFLLDDLNTSIECDDTIAINVSAVDSGNNLTTGTTALRFNATYTSGNVDFTFTGNHTGAIYNLYIDDIYYNIYESESFSFSHSSWSEVDFEIELAGYRPDPPYNGTSNYLTDELLLNLTWLRGNNSDREIVVRNNASFSTSPSDGTIQQNGTDLFFNESVTSSGYFTIWSYNDTNGYFSATGLNIPWGALGVTVYNESSPWLTVSPFGLLISNQEGTETYQNSTCTDTHYLDMLDIPYGVNTVFVINATYYVDRTYYFDMLENMYLNLTLYLPPFEEGVDEGSGDPDGSGENYSTIQDYVINIIDELDSPVEGAKVIIRRYINTTESWNEIASGITDGYGQVPVSLFPGILYKVNITADGYKDSLGNDWIPKYIEFTDDRYKTFQLEFEDIEPYPPAVYDEEITFTAIRTDGCILYVNYTDALGETIDTQIYVYEYNLTNTEWVLIHTNTTTGIDDFGFTITVNCTDNYRITLHHNHTTFGYQTQTLFVDAEIDTVTTQARGDDLFTLNYGWNPFGWTNLFMWFLLVAAAYSADQRDAGKILILIGGLFIFLNSIIGFNTALSVAAGGIIPVLFIIIGIMVMWNDSRKKAAG